MGFVCSRSIPSGVCINMKNIYLLQASNLGGYRGSFLAWTPYSIGCLWAYASQFKEITDHVALKEMMALKEPMDDIVNRLDNPSMFGFSSYVWNFNYNIELSRRIKQRYPKCKIVFGGPHINRKTLSNYPHIDAIIIAEAELSFKQLLEDLIKGDIDTVYERERIDNLEILPSPYASGVFDQLLDSHPELVWAATLETNRGCPYSCTFCDWGSLTASKVHKMSLERLQADCDWIKSKGNLVQINIADANFGIFKERDLEAARIIRQTIDDGNVNDIQISYAKKFNKELYDIILLLNQPTGFQISLQTDNKDTLKAIKRKNLPEEDIAKLITFADEHSISHEQEYILGLPLETKATWYDSMTNRLDQGEHKVFDVFICSILPNTEMSNEYYRKQYGIKSVLTPDLNSVAPTSEADFQVLEYSEIVTETSTMPREELVDCFLFSHIIHHVHATGYSFIVSQIALKQYGVEMLKFYQELEKRMYAHSDVGKQLRFVRSLLNEMFDTGRIQNPAYKEEGRLDLSSYKPFYKLKNQLMQLSIDALQELTECDDATAKEVLGLQRMYTFDVTHKEQQTYTSEFNISSFQQQRTQYTVTTNIDKGAFIKQWKGSGSFQHLHQEQQLVNTFTEIPTARSKLEKLSIEITN
jgi:putative methyltransferase